MYEKESINWYLAHPVMSRHEIRAWELRIETVYDIVLKNPFYDFPRPDIVELDNSVNDHYATVNANELVTNDLRRIYASTGVVAIVDGNLSYGTIVEMAYAKLHSIPVYLICTNGKELHPWLRFCSIQLFTSFEEFEGWLKKNLK
jgi:nucleoside 2-deoxyribosyltransferase